MLAAIIMYVGIVIGISLPEGRLYSIDFISSFSHDSISDNILPHFRSMQRAIEGLHYLCLWPRVELGTSRVIV